ncbi:MAG TPA: hypothetical protein VLC28_09345 [Flavitalea sp.]|nr:hypothetical protein [Flavitalea sp.]
MHIIPRKVARSLLIVVGILLGAYLLSGVLNKILGVDSVLTQAFYAAFDMDGEDNVPAAFSFLILIIAAALLIVVGITTRIKGHRKFWIGLSMIFFFLGCDEFMQIHEHLGMYMKAHTTASVGGSNFVWVLPYGIFALVVGALLLRFVLLLPKNTRKLFFIAGFLYVFSALVIDYTQGIIQKQELPKIYYKLLTCIEEPGEMVAIIIFIYALLDYLAPPQGNIKIEVAEKLA